MTIQEFAKMLDGREMGEEMTWADKAQARKLGLVVVFGYSDDNAMFEGAIDDEASCFDGAEIYLNKDGVFGDCEEGCRYSKAAKEKCKVIEAVWHDEGPIAWTYETDIPHATFDVMEDGEVWCRGIVFDIKSLEEEEAQKETANKNIIRLMDLIEIYNQAGVLRPEFEAFTGYDEPIETIEELIEAMESEISYWEPEGE